MDWISTITASRRRFPRLWGSRTATRSQEKTQKASLLSLPTDVLSRITDLLQSTSPTSLAQLSLVNERLHSVAQYSQHYHVTFDLSQAGEDQLLRQCQLIESAGLELAIREVKILQCHSTPQRKEVRFQHRVEMLCRTLGKLTALREVTHTDFTISVDILAALPPQAMIHTSYTGDRELEDRSLDGLCGNANLSSLDVRVTWYAEKQCRSMMEGVKEVLLSSPNLRSLRLDVSQPTSGCVIFTSPSEDVGFAFKNGERPPPLESLELISYDLWLGEIEYWAEHFDWSRLKRLTTGHGHGEFAIKAAKHFTALEEIHFLDDRWLPYWSEVFDNVPSRLRSVTMALLTEVPLDGLLRHSETLEGLRLHGREDGQGRWSSKCLSTENIEVIANRCPHIRSLSLDMARSGAWPYTTFDALAAFPGLQDLEIWFELGMTDYEHPIQPFITFQSSRHIYEYLRGRCKSLQKLTLHSGDPRPFGFGFPGPGAYWPSHNVTCFDCQPSERDDDDGVTITCPILERHEKSLLRAEQSAAMQRTPTGKIIRNGLQRILAPDDYRRERAAEFRLSGSGQAKRRRDEAFVVAHEGPRPLSKWDSHF